MTALTNMTKSRHACYVIPLDDPESGCDMARHTYSDDEPDVVTHSGWLNHG